MRRSLTIMVAAAVIANASVAAAKPPLRDVPEIDGGILTIGIADEIRKNCPRISARMLRAMRRINGLKDRALALGYSEDEIRAYRTSDAEKARLRAAGAAYLKSNGVQVGKPDTYCALGRAEIQKNSAIGALLRER